MLSKLKIWFFHLIGKNIVMKLIADFFSKIRGKKSSWSILGLIVFVLLKVFVAIPEELQDLLSVIISGFAGVFVVSFGDKISRYRELWVKIKKAGDVVFDNLEKK